MLTRRSRLWWALALAVLPAAEDLRWPSLARKACRLGPRAHSVAADLSAMESPSADLCGEDPRRARWKGIQRAIANLAGARLDGGLLIGADLEWTNPLGASLRGVVCRQGNLGAADLKGSDRFCASLLEGAFGHTRCPDGRWRSTACQGFVVPWPSQPWLTPPPAPPNLRPMTTLP